jgi:hypothetical protein
MQDIQNEFGGSPPIGLDEYYAGGANVPAGTEGIPSSGTISMDNLRGKTKITPVTVSVNFSSRPEGDSFTATPSTLTPIYGILYWKLTNYTNLQDADFNVTSGTSSLNTESNTYGAFVFNPVTDDSFEGPGTFTISVYSDSARTILVGESSLLTVTDTYSIGTTTLSRSDIYRYANLNQAYRSSVVTLNVSGLIGATVHYEVFTNSGSLTSADIDNPLNLTGTLSVTGTQVQIVVRATEWDGSTSITTSKNVFVRFRLTNSSGTVLSTSSAIFLYPMPVASFSFSPTTVREGQAITVTGSITNIPYDGSSSFFYTQSSLLGTATQADWVGTNGTPGLSQDQITWTQQVITLTIYAALDTLTESTETLAWLWRLNSFTGTAISVTTVDIQSPAQVISASASASSVQITNISSYPVSRTFNVAVIIDGSANTGGSITVSAGQVSSNAIVPFLYVATTGTSGTYNMQYEFTNPSYETFTVTRFPETFIFPIYGVEFVFTGANADATARTLVGRITNIPALGYSRNFNVEFQARVAGTSTWNDWAPIPGNVVIPVETNAVSSISTTLYSATSSGLFDFQFRVLRSGHETKLSPVFSNIWL